MIISLTFMKKKINKQKGVGNKLHFNNELYYK